MITRKALEYVFKTFEGGDNNEQIDECFKWFIDNAHQHWIRTSDFSTDPNRSFGMENRIIDDKTRESVSVFVAQWLMRHRNEEKQKDEAIKNGLGPDKLEYELTKRIDSNFLDILVDAGKAYGWDGDYNEIADFIGWCFELVGKEPPDLTPHDKE